MKKKPSRSHKGIWVLVVALLLVVLAWGASALFPGRLPFLDNAIGTVTSPLKSAAASVADWVEHMYVYTYAYDALLAENEALKLRIAEMELQVQEAQESDRENERLRTLLGLDGKRFDKEWDSAIITARSSSNWSSTLTISKGSAHGIELNDCVVTESMYLIGVIVEVGYNWSTILTVIDAEFEMGAFLSRTEELCVAEGDFSLMTQGKLRLSYFPERSGVMRGDTVLTSGRSGLYPSGLTIGRVEEVLLDDSGITRYAVLSPSADLEALTQVFVIKDFDVVE